MAMINAIGETNNKLERIITLLKSGDIKVRLDGADKEGKVSDGVRESPKK